MKRLMLMFAAVGLLCVLSACQTEVEVSAGSSGETEEEEKDERLPVEVAAVETGTIESVVRSSANLEAEAKVQVFAKTANRSAELLVEEGDRVERDQLLLRLEDEEQTIRLAKAKASLAKSERDFARTKDLFEKELVTSQEYNNASFDLEQAQLEVEEAEQSLRYTRVLAPISGTITQRMVNLGDMVNTGSPVFEIVDIASTVARVYLPEKHLSTLAVGQKARLTAKALGDQQHAGSVRRIAPTVDARTGTVKVTVGVDEIGNLRPGMYVDVSLVLATHEDVVLLPKRALVYDNDQIFVYRLTEDGEDLIAERVLVDVVLTDRDYVEPRGGIEHDDKIIVAGQTGLKNGSKVRLLGSEAPGAELNETSRTADVTP